VDVTSMPLQHQIGQRMMVGFDGPELSEDVIRLIREYKIGNIILFSWNITSKGQMMDLCRQIQELVLKETGLPAFIAIDQEGGAVSRLPSDATRIPGAMALAATGDPDCALEAGRITGRELRTLGANFNLAPVLDVNSNDDNPVIGVRSYGSEPETVVRFALAMMRGLKEGGVLSCGKHFPGHGDTSVDSHLALPTVDKSLEELRRTELVPFQAAIDAGIPAIMSSHILFPQLDPDVPATMSRRILTDLLKGEMGFSGLVLTDCLEMKAIRHSFGTVHGALSALKAGADLVLISHTASLAEEAAQAIYDAWNAGEFDAAEWNESLEKIAKLKWTYGTLPAADPEVIGCNAHRDTNMALLKRTISPVNVPGGRLPELGARPHFVGCPAFRATLVSSVKADEVTFPEYMAARLQGRATVSAPNPTEEDIAAVVRETSGATSIVVGTYNGHLHPGQIALVNALAKTGVPVIAVALRNPYDLKMLDRSVYSLAAYEYTDQLFDALVEVLQGKAVPGGKVPVDVMPS